MRHALVRKIVEVIDSDCPCQYLLIIIYIHLKPQKWKMHKIYLSVCAVYDFFFNPSASFWSCSVFKMNRWIPFFHEPFLEAIASLEITFSLSHSVTQSGSFLLLCIFLKNQIPGKSQVYLRHISQAYVSNISDKSHGNLRQISGWSHANCRLISDISHANHTYLLDKSQIIL